MNNMIKEVNFNIYVDLDGVILDVSERLYQIYRELMMEFGGSCLPKGKYWQMKKTKTPIPEMRN